MMLSRLPLRPYGTFVPTDLEAGPRLGQRPISLAAKRLSPLLPNDILVEVIAHLPPADLRRFAKVSPLASTLLRAPAIWRQHEAAVGSLSLAGFNRAAQLDGFTLLARAQSTAQTKRRCRLRSAAHTVAALLVFEWLYTTAIGLSVSSLSTRKHWRQQEHLVLQWALRFSLCGPFMDRIEQDDYLSISLTCVAIGFGPPIVLLVGLVGMTILQDALGSRAGGPQVVQREPFFPLSIQRPWPERQILRLERQYEARELLLAEAQRALREISDHDGVTLWPSLQRLRLAAALLADCAIAKPWQQQLLAAYRPQRLIDPSWHNELWAAGTSVTNLLPAPTSALFDLACMQSNVLLFAALAAQRVQPTSEQCLRFAAQADPLTMGRVLMATGSMAAFRSQLGEEATSRCSATGDSVLHTIVHRQLPAALCDLWVAAGANVHLADSRGRTALHVAAATCQRATAASLVKAGARYDSVDHAGRTPVMLLQRAFFSTLH